MADPELTVEFASEQALAEQFEAELRRGGAFVAGPSDVTEGQLCELVLVHPVDGARKRYPARVVWQGERQGQVGVAVAIDGFGPELRRELAEFIAAHAGGEATGEAAGAETASASGAQPLHERVRGLSSVEQARLAREGDLSERVLLERIYGKGVWEPLLRNPRLTPPEVVRIARMGALPLPLLETIVGNASWLGNGQVRRALLSNPRLGRDMATKVLRAMPKAELRLVPKQTAYSAAVRQVAAKMLGR
ncbi:MAG: PilZ domain-containing protein [Deltaproteobacteria bacterium]|jgi:hypothetical protein|nr:PilZ domain-containing protein [Deltaproteobacteria bacterium]MBW2535457.1 PilZ domain-containing protein [Deltaproteobacteria bacterium]